MQLNFKPPATDLRIGIDLGGTKIAGVTLDQSETVIKELRIDSPRNDYQKTLTTIAGVVDQLRYGSASSFTVGLGIPGAIAPSLQRVQNANSTWLNDQTLQSDLEALLGYEIQCANDANCFVLSEAYDGSAAGSRSAFGVILGTGCGGGFIINANLLNGPRNIGGEWGHNPLPWPEANEVGARTCWCGLENCIETWISGPAMAHDHLLETGETLTAQTIVKHAGSRDNAAQATLDRHLNRTARSLAHVINILDPEVVVLGGGLSAMEHLYDRLEAEMAPYIFSADRKVDIRQPRWGDASGVRGAARLWQLA